MKRIAITYLILYVIFGVILLRISDVPFRGNEINTIMCVILYTCAMGLGCSFSMLIEALLNPKNR